uniref:B- and T-lymphocyte attenuator isoform X1 n=1 Tax=Pogona vitticeps TaxID=103695 RepID=A0A6J0V5B6_9SAUR
MNTGRFALQFLLLMLMVDEPWASDQLFEIDPFIQRKEAKLCITEKKSSAADKNENCTICISVPRGTKYYACSGDSVTIECPVMYCQEKPLVHWYRYSKENKTFFALPHGERHTVSWTNENNFNVFSKALNFPSVNKNDSGLYRCEASVGENKIPGYTTEVIVQDLDNCTLFEDEKNTTKEHGEAEKSKMLTIYTLSSLGAMGLLIFWCFILYSMRRHQEKDKKSSTTSQIEMNVVDNRNDAQCCNDTTMQSFVQGPTPPSLLYPEGNVVYGNQSHFRKARKTVAKPMPSRSITNHFSPANQEALVYATLNHGDPFHSSEPSLENEFIEYASIVVKN